jgi:hypothetical protein
LVSSMSFTFWFTTSTDSVSSAGRLSSAMSRR